MPRKNHPYRPLARPSGSAINLAVQSESARNVANGIADLLRKAGFKDPRVYLRTDHFGWTVETVERAIVQVYDNGPVDVQGHFKLHVKRLVQDVFGENWKVSQHRSVTPASYSLTVWSADYRSLEGLAGFLQSVGFEAQIVEG